MHQFQWINLNALISMQQFQWLNFNASIAMHQSQCINPNESMSMHQSQCIIPNAWISTESVSYGNHYILATNIEAQCNCIFCESRFLVILISPWDIISIWKSLHSGYKYWGPIQLYFLRIPIFNNLDLSTGIYFPHGNH